MREALADLKVVLDENPDAVGSRYLRGVIRAKTGDAPGGAADMAAARAMGPPVDRNDVPFGIVL